jgi:hypothetical protein
MKRLLIILMLFIAPLQSGLAAVCGYSAHWARDAGDNHALVHGKAAADQHAEAAGDTASTIDNGECALCHLGCGSAVTEPMTAPSVNLGAHAPPVLSVFYDPSHLDRIDRVPLPAARSS